MSKRSIEWGKNILILVLLISAVFTGWKSGIFKDLYYAGEFEYANTLLNLQKISTAEIKTAAAMPAALSVTDENGQCLGVRYDLNTIQTDYAKVSTIFGEALGSSSELQEIDADAWQQILKSQNAYLEYNAAAPMSVIGAWFGTSVSEEIADIYSKKFCIYYDRGDVGLAFCDEEEKFYTCATVCTKDGLDSAVSGFEGNKAYFVFRDIASGILMSSWDSPLMILTASYPLENNEVLSEVLEKFDVNEVTGTTYTEGDGTQVFVENDFTLRLTKDGIVSYNYSGEKNVSDSVTDAQAVEAARQLVEATIGAFCGDVYTQCAEVESVDGTHTVNFSYYFDGICCVLPNAENAAEITVENGRITEAVFCFRTYTVTDRGLRVMPEEQAVAAAEGEPNLVYINDGTGAAIPEWVYSGEK